MAKELKQRKIKSYNKKYIKLGIVIASVIVIIILIVLFIKFVKSNKKHDDSNQVDNNINSVTNKTINEIKNITNESENNNTQNPETLYPDLESLTSNNNNIILGEEPEKNTEENTDKKVIKSYASSDAALKGIQREMTTKQVQQILGSPESKVTEEEQTTEYTVLKYYYHGGQTEIDFVALYEKEQYLVHRIKTKSPDMLIERGLKVGDTMDSIIETYRRESILYKESDLIIIGYPDENPIYATSIRPKIYFKLENNVISQISISLGSES